jgi:hypothetical protein
MAVTRKIVKSAAWSLGGVLGLALLILLIAVIVNWRDKPPSADAEKLRDILQSRARVPDGDNAYIYILGFSAPEEMDPQDAGTQRLQWIKQKGYANGSASTEPFQYVNLTRDRPKEIEQLRSECLTATRRCAVTFESNTEALSRWIGEQPLLLSRYRALLGRTAFLEHVSDDVAMPLPPYSDVIEGQRMYFASLVLSGDQMNPDAVRSALQADLAFWRGVLSSSDYLITKMIAVAAMRYHFALGNLVLRSLPSERMLEAVPPSWHQEFEAEERSMMRVMAGELRFSEGIVRDLEATGEPDLSTMELNLVERLFMVMFQQQDTLNQLATSYLGYAERFDAPWDQYPHAQAQASETVPRRAFTRLYNIVGDYLFDAGAMQFKGYAVRVGDLEGMRRAALLITELRTRGVPVEDMERELKIAERKNHYTGAPFEWSEEERTVVFVGLEEGERGRHAYVY